MKKVHIKASMDYDIIIEAGILKEAGRYIKEAAPAESAVIVSDDTVYNLYGEMLKKELLSAGYKVNEFVFPHGEMSKNLETYGEILEYMSKTHMTRGDIVAALGGGVVGDMAGFAAATYQRGIRYVQIPTTLLACVDSSVGGKTAVDLKHGKNQVGCFYQPSLVLCDIDTLKTLPEDEYKCGCAEVIKYSVIGNREFFDKLMETPVKDQLEEVISTCAEMKRDIVEKDEFDTGERMLLNLGHTFGHAIEACSNFKILHGQAVSIGLAVMVRSAFTQGYIDKKDAELILQLLEKYDLPTGTDYGIDDMAAALYTDKKMSGSTMRLIVPEKIGKCSIKKIPSIELKDWLYKGGIR